VDDLLLRQAIVENKDLSGLCRSLVDHANNNGGTDNITVVVGRWVRATHADGMPIFEEFRGQSSLFREIAFPPEETETADIETIHLSSYDLREYPTESLDEED
jgi:serine/threonine protein phosphatase PrpC